jgi:hypothetical protein
VKKVFIIEKSLLGLRWLVMLGKGRMPSGFGGGPGGDCVCSKCGARIAHQRGVPCYEQKCPKCGTPMTR